MFGALPDKVFTDRRLSHADVRVLLMVAAHANKANKAWPSAVTIAERLGMSRTTVMNALKRGVRLGYLSKRDRHSKGLKVACEYTLLFDRFDGQSTSMSNESTSMSNGCTSMSNESATMSSDGTQTYQGTYQGTDQGTLGLVADAPKKQRAKRKKAEARPKDAAAVQDYAAEWAEGKGVAITSTFGERFVAHYEAAGWKRGKSPVKDWKATVRTWVLQRKDKGNALRPGQKNPRSTTPHPQSPPPRRKTIFDCADRAEWIALNEAKKPDAPDYMRQAWEAHWQAHISDPKNRRQA